MQKSERVRSGVQLVSSAFFHEWIFGLYLPACPPPPCTNVSLLACREQNRITSLIPEGGEAL